MKTTLTDMKNDFHNYLHMYATNVNESIKVDFLRNKYTVWFCPSTHTTPGAQQTVMMVSLLRCLQRDLAI